MVIFEIEHFVRVNAAFSQLTDDLNRYGSQILADHHTAVTLTLQRQNRQQIVYRILNVSTVIGRLTVRDPPQTQHRHHVIDAQRPAVLHISAQQLDKWLIGARHHDMRVHRRQAPVLSQRTQNVRRRPDGGFQTVQLAIAPGFRSAFRNADRQIAIQTDRHGIVLAGMPALGELGVSEPLQPQVKIHLVGMLGTECFNLRAIGILVSLRPRGPAPAHRILLNLPGVQRVIRRLPVQTFALTGHKLTELRRRLIIARGKTFPGHAQRSELKSGHGGIVNVIGLARGL